MSSITKPTLVAGSAALTVALLGGLSTRIGPWYETLEKPALNPPNWLFAPAWTMIYALCVVAAVMGWRNITTNAGRAWLLSLFFMNAVLNIMWSVLFFTFQRPDWALAEVITLWLSVAALLVFFMRSASSVAWLMVPYLAWVTFAAYLNLRIVALNGPFG